MLDAGAAATTCWRCASLQSAVVELQQALGTPGIALAASYQEELVILPLVVKSPKVSSPPEGLKGATRLLPVLYGRQGSRR